MNIDSRPACISLIITQKMLPLLVCWLVCLTVSPSKATDNFPLYPAIRTNVAFWEKVYSTYSVNTAVIHDRNDLSKIYETVPLLDENLPAAGRINSALVTLAIEKYGKILQNLAEGNRPSTETEKRIAVMFKGNDSRQHMAQASEAVRSQKGQKERFREGVMRSGRYMAGIRTIFKGYGLPVELAYLPHVESSFNTDAYSKAGASGIWQFTLGTGKRYLRIDDAVDERSDPFIAARAAARYLRDGYEKLGSWPLALTAYNYGTAGMVRAKVAKGSYERIFREYREGNFGFASQNFYAEFLAAIRVARKLEASQQIRLDRPVQFAEFMLPSYIHLEKIRRHFSVSDTTIKSLNPAILSAVYSGEKLLPAGYPLRLPSTHQINRQVAKVPESYFQKNQTSDKYHLVRQGETLTRIAALYQVKIKVLAAANGLQHDAKVRIGQRLRIPPRTSGTTATAQPRTLTATDTKQFKIRLIPSTAPAASGQPLVLSAETNKIEYISAN